MNPPTATRESGTGTPGGGPTDPGGGYGNGDVVRDGVGGRRYPVGHPVAAAR